MSLPNHFNIYDFYIKNLFYEKNTITINLVHYYF